VSNPATPHDGAGTVLRLGAVTYTVTNIVIANANPGEGEDAKVPVGHLGQTTGETLAQMDRPLVVPADDGGTGRQVTFDYLGKTVILDGTTGTYHIQVASATLVGGSTVSYYTVQSSTLTLATNDAIRGQATLSVAR